MNPQSKLHDKLRKLEALFQRAGSAGERAAAEAALGRLSARLGREFRPEPNRPQPEPQRRPRPAPPVLEEFQCTFPDQWSAELFKAVCSKYGVETYRYKRQRYTTVMVRVAPDLLDNVIWPEHEKLSSELRSYISDVTGEMIRRVKDSSRKA